MIENLSLLSKHPIDVQLVGDNIQLTIKPKGEEEGTPETTVILPPIKMIDGEKHANFCHLTFDGGSVRMELYWSTWTNSNLAEQVGGGLGIIDLRDILRQHQGKNHGEPFDHPFYLFKQGKNLLCMTKKK